MKPHAKAIVEHDSSPLPITDRSSTSVLTARFARRNIILSFKCFIGDCVSPEEVVKF